MAKTYYDLRINGDYIVGLPSIVGFENTSDYLNLNLFTGLFNDVSELLSALEILKTLPDGNISDIEIVRRTGNKKDGYDYEFVSQRLLFKKDVPLLDEKNIRRFFNINVHEYDVLHKIVEDFIVPIENLYTRKSVDLAKSNAIINGNKYGLSKEDLASSEKKSASIQNSLRKMGYSITIMQNLLSSITAMKEGTMYGPYNGRGEVLREYPEIYNKFIDDIIYYSRDGVKMPNNLGLVNLAHSIAINSRSSNTIIMPRVSIKYKGIQDDYRDMLNYYNSRDKDVLKTKLPQIDEIEADEYMFLEEEDYYAMLPSFTKEKAYESIENQIENLKDIKKTNGY